MNYRLLAKLLGLLLWLLSGTMAVCLAYASWNQDQASADVILRALSMSVAITAGTGTVLLILGRGSGREILRKEAISVVGLGWFVCAIFGALPYVLCEPRLGPVKAIFESMSGFTTTGATVIEDLTQYPQALLLWRSLTQWLGGLGILVLFVALLSSLGVGSKALFQHESSAKTGTGGVQARIQDLAMRLWLIYAAFTVACCLGLVLLGMGPYEAVCHSLTAISTGGFSPRNTSIEAYGSWAIELWLVAFMILGGISFMLYVWLLRRKWARWRVEEEAKIYLGILLVAVVVVATDLVLVEGEHPYTVVRALREALFQVVSIMTTTGFSSADFDQWPALSRFLLLVLMAIGGCAGSTAGGIKVSRWILFFKTVKHEVVRAFRPNQVFSLRLNGNLVDEPLKMQAAFFVALAGVSIGLGTMCVSLFEPSMDIDSCLSAVMACVFNIGPGLVDVGPTRNFAFLGNTSLGVLSLLMLLGRLEFFAVLVLFVPSLWRKY